MDNSNYGKSDVLMSVSGNKPVSIMSPFADVINKNIHSFIHLVEDKGTSL